MPLPIQQPLPLLHDARENHAIQDFLLAACQQQRNSVLPTLTWVQDMGKDCWSLPPNSFSQVLPSVLMSVGICCGISTQSALQLSVEKDHRIC